MIKGIEMCWYSVDDVLPGANHGMLLIRFITEDESDLFSLAEYNKKTGLWIPWQDSKFVDLNDDFEYIENDLRYREKIKITHWAFIPEFEHDHMKDLPLEPFPR